MAGQSANLTMNQACTQQERIQHPQSQAGGKRNASKGGAKGDHIDKKVAHQG
jgi:hypothetical protein